MAQGRVRTWHKAEWGHGTKQRDLSLKDLRVSENCGRRSDCDNISQRWYFMTTICFEGFDRKCFRGKQALAITANFVNWRTRADNQVEEIGGIFRVFKPKFFEHLQTRANIDLENFVYYRNDTHYFVMTAKRQSLLDKGVLKEVRLSYKVNRSISLLHYM